MKQFKEPIHALNNIANNGERTLEIVYEIHQANMAALSSPYLSQKQAAYALHVETKTIRQYEAENLITSVSVKEGGKPLYLKSEIFNLAKKWKKEEDEE